MPPPAVELRNISKSFGGREVLKKLNLEIEPREFFVLLGENGSGKSTMLRLIAGLEAPDSGEIFMHGKSVGRLPPVERSVSCVLQAGGYYDDLSVKRNLLSVTRGGATHRSADESRCSEVIQWLDLASLLDRTPNSLSGGELQRLALARGLCRSADLILLDEPFSQMTASARIHNQQRLRQFQQSSKSTMIHVTHNVEEAMYLADRLAVLHDGFIQQIGTPQSLFDSPNNLCVARMLCPKLSLFRATIVRNEPIISVRLGDETFAFQSAGRIEALSEAKPYSVLLAIRPELLEIDDTEPANCGQRQSGVLKFQVQIIEVRYILGQWQYLCSMPDGSTITVPRRHRVSQSMGDRLVVYAPLPCFQFFDANTQNRLGVAFQTAWNRENEIPR